MANVTIPASGTGDATPVVATDEVGGVHFQQMKLVDATAGSTTPIGTPSNPLPVSMASLPIPSGASTEVTLAAVEAKIGTATEAVPATDTASSGLNGRLQRIAQRITSLIALIPNALTGSGNFKVSVAEATATQPISASSLPLPTGAATEATLSSLNGKVTAVNTGAVVVSSSALPSGAATESTLSGFFSSFVSAISALLTAIGNPFQTGGTAAATQSGTWTVQPGNTANTTAWKVDGSSVTQPVSASALPLPSGAATEATISTLNGKVTAVNTGAVVVSSSALPSGAATAAEQATQTASLSVIDDWDESDRAKVNLIVGQAGIAAGTGVDGVTVPRVTLATNVGLPAGTALIGKAGIDQTTPGTTNAVAPIAGQNGVAGGAGAVAANVQRTTLSSDDPAVATLGATTDAAVSTDATGSLSAKIRGLIKIFTTLTQSIYQKFGTSVVFANTGGNVVMTMKNIATGAGRISAQKDWGATPQPGWYKWEATMLPTSSPTLGLSWRIYAFCSYASATAIDTATTDTALTAETQLSNFTKLGDVYVSVSGAGPFYNSGVVFLPGRYMNLGWWNASGVNTANTDTTTTITMTPLFPNQQSWS